MEMGALFLVPTDGVQLEPLTSEAYGIRGVLPAGWVNVGSGLFARLNSNGDLAFLLMVKLPNLPLDQHLGPRLQRLGIDELPESIGRYETPAFTWDLYTFEGNVPSLGGMVIVDYAIASSATPTALQDAAQTDAGIYLVGLHTPPGEYEALHEAVFLPVVDALAPTE